MAQAINKVIQAGSRNQEIIEYGTGHRQEKGQREHRNGSKPGDQTIHKLQRLNTISHNTCNGGGVETINVNNTKDKRNLNREITRMNKTKDKTKTRTEAD